MDSLSTKRMDCPIGGQFWTARTSRLVPVHQVAEVFQAIEVGDVEVGGGGIGLSALAEAIGDLLAEFGQIKP